MICAENRTGPKKKRGVLIADDDPEVTSFLDGLLSTLYSVTTSHDGRSVIEKIEAPENEVDIVVLDYRLPDISGLEVLKEIKRIRSNIPVIFITAYGDEEVAVKAFRYGAREYLKKPFNYNELLHMISFSLALTSLNPVAPRKTLISEPDRYASDLLQSVNHSRIKYRLQKALIYINNNYMYKISRDMAAKTACASKCHFSREFKKAT